MSDLNFQLLQENIRSLIDKNGITQQKLAEIAGMTQANVSKALNPNEKKQFTIEQLYRISQHFGVSIDTLVGNTTNDQASMSPSSMLALISKLMRNTIIRSTTVTIKESVFEQMYNHQGYRDCHPETIPVEYPAFYFPDYYRVDDFGKDDETKEDVYYEFLDGGNDTKFQRLNIILKKIIPFIELYRKTEIPDEALQMVLDGYLKQLEDK